MSCDSCLSRRDFLTRSTLVVAGTVLGGAALGATTACGDGQIGAGGAGGGPTGPSPVPAGGLSVRVATLPGLATVGQLVLMPGSSGKVVVKRTGASAFAALDTACTHEGTQVNIVNNAFVCPNHNAAFNNDGALTRQPSNGGSASGPLRRLTATYDAASDILTVA